MKGTGIDRRDRMSRQPNSNWRQPLKDLARGLQAGTKSSRAMNQKALLKHSPESRRAPEPVKIQSNKKLSMEVQGVLWGELYTP